ncbi:hypothetical protein FNV43_RR23731 [Rhamnella rubrinervis]|uniref:BolA-like protein n=1 Tax=Rhamnella rubrinervis TaxID=2594499 RepID=A0A8K0DQX1_9ROSA|nr:hypothetical protein FNV43_RR23731 [Rhamnella rubrinervis]
MWAKTIRMRPLVRQALPFIFGSGRTSLAFQKQSLILLNKASGHTARLRIQKHECGKFSSTPSSTSKSEMDGQRCFTTSIRATHVDDAGSMDSPLMQSMENKIKKHLNAESVTVKDSYGDGRHVSIVVVSSAFEGQSAVNRQRMVYKAIWEELQSTVHAVDQMTTKTPNEASAEK